MSANVQLSPARGSRDTLVLLSGIALLIATVLLAFPALTRMLSLLNYPYAHDGLEGTLLYEARLMHSGQALYQPLERYRFVSAPYPPLAYLALMLFDLVQGPHIFWAGRLVFFLSALGTALLVARIVRYHASWPVALFAAALFLSVPPLQLWGTRIKPDLLALFFTSLGLFLATRTLVISEKRAGPSLDVLDGPHPLPPSPIAIGAGETHPNALQRPSPADGRAVKGESFCFVSAHNAWSLGLAALAFTLGFYTKQTAVAGPFAVGLALLMADWRAWRAGAERSRYVWKFPFQWRTLAFALGYLLLALGTWLVLDLMTAGQYSLHVWWSGDRSQWWSFGLFRKIVGLLDFWWPQMLLSALLIPFAISRPGLFVPLCYVLVAPITLLGAGETGSHHNHLLETHLALTLAGCSALGVILHSIARPRPTAQAAPQPLGGLTQRRGIRLSIAVLAMLLTGIQVVQALHPPEWYKGELEPSGTPERYLAFIRATAGEILADDTGLLFQAGRELRYDDPSTMGPAAKIGKWDQSGLLEEISQKKFSAIMIPVNIERSAIDPAGRWTPEMIAAIKEHYKLKFRDTIYVYEPR